MYEGISYADMLRHDVELYSAILLGSFVLAYSLYLIAKYRERLKNEG
jgi:hypothetical protein